MGTALRTTGDMQGQRAVEQGGCRRDQGPRQSVGIEKGRSTAARTGAQRDMIGRFLRIDDESTRRRRIPCHSQLRRRDADQKKAMVRRQPDFVATERLRLAYESDKRSRLYLAEGQGEAESGKPVPEMKAGR